MTIKVLKARDEFEIRAYVDDFIEDGYSLHTAPYKVWYASQETKWRAKVEAPRGQLEQRANQPISKLLDGGWSMEHGAWSMEHGAWSMENGDKTI